MKLTTAIVAASCVAGATATLTESQYEFLFSRFVQKYEKKYESKAMFTKYNTFKKNLDFVIAHNSKESTYTLAVNNFSDMTEDEFAQLMNSKMLLDAKLQGQLNMHSNETCDALNDSIDWSEIISNPVKNQQSCGSCWAFAVVGALEYRYANDQQLSSAIQLSEQQLVDCDLANEGCSGGLMEPGYDYIKSQKGLCTVERYPYQARRGACLDKMCTPVSNFSSIGIVDGGEQGLRDVIKEGPTTVGIAASVSCFQFYKSGVITNCTSSNLNHAVIAVGYGTEAGVPYIKLRNSWGASWGDNGYAKIEYCKNTIGIKHSIDYGHDAYPII